MAGSKLDNIIMEVRNSILNFSLNETLFSLSTKVEGAEEVQHDDGLVCRVNLAENLK
jgi:hypothetical protein